MYFVYIATMSDGENFVGWMKGENRRAFNDSEEFQEWLEGRKVFPLEFYLEGVTYRFRNEDELEFFILGFETAMRLL